MGPPGQAAGEDKRQQRDEKEYSGNVEKPVVPQMPPRRAGGIAFAMSFVGMMMMFAHK